jgi:MoaA/NifB/PqqE/SkfB family radical SAM enzyme
VTEIACALYGEMLASRSNVEMIRNLKLKHWPGIRFQLRTNGTLLHTPAFTEVMDSVGPLDVVLSMDGASKATFERLRRGADFGRVLDNLKILARLREAGRIKFFQVTTVVQQDNFRELQAVLDLAREARADLVRFDRYQLQTQGLEEYERCDVQRRDHPDHAAFLEISRKIQSRPAGTPVVLWNPAPPEG